MLEVKPQAQELSAGDAGLGIHYASTQGVLVAEFGVRHVSPNPSHLSL